MLLITCLSVVPFGYALLQDSDSKPITRLTIWAVAMTKTGARRPRRESVAQVTGARSQFETSGEMKVDGAEKGPGRMRGLKFLNPGAEWNSVASALIDPVKR
jgi:hypothetical protein